MSVIEINDLSKFYGQVRGIENLNLKVEQGEVFGFIGPNGAGKSTTIRLLLNLIFPTSGSASVLGHDVIKESKQLKRKVGFLPSEVYYYDHMTVEELLQYSAQFFKIKPGKYYKELIDRFEVNPQRELRDLSSGNKKKVAIIQALLHRPDLLILDEPTNGLDPLMQNVFFEVLREANQAGTTIFLSSHILGDVQRLCERVAVIREGKIVETETIKELLKKQWKKCRLELSQEPAEDMFDFKGIHDLEVRNSIVKFNYSGKPDELISKLAKFEMIDLNIENQSLEEIFMRYYERN